MKKEVAQIFDDLEALHDFCRFNLLPFNEADLYNRNSKVFRDFEWATKPKKPWNGERKPYLGKNPRPQYNNRNDNFSR